MQLNECSRNAYKRLSAACFTKGCNKQYHVISQGFHSDPNSVIDIETKPAFFMLSLLHLEINNVSKSQTIKNAYVSRYYNLQVRKTHLHSYGSCLPIITTYRLKTNFWYFLCIPGSFTCFPDTIHL